MCYGDPSYGRDGIYQQWLEEQERRDAEEVAEWGRLEEELSDGGDRGDGN